MIEMRYAEKKATRVVLTLNVMDDQQRNRKRGTFNDCNSSTFNMVMGQSNLYRNIKPPDVDISHIRNVLAYKLSMTVSGQKSKNVFVMESNAVS